MLPEADGFARALRAFLRPTIRGKVRAWWRRMFPPPAPARTAGFEVGDVLTVVGDQHKGLELRIISKTRTTLTLEGGMVVTL